MASQSKSAKVEKALIEITFKIDNEPVIKETREIIYNIQEKGFDEFLNILRVTPIEEKVYQVVNFKLTRLPKFIPYTNATIVEEMKKRGLGRPSTYSTIIQTLLERKYVILNKGYLIPTKYGKIIYEYLKEKYPDLISENLTKQLEEAMDKIETNQLDYQTVLNNLFIRVFGII
jgi:reverse gyrase